MLNKITKIFLGNLPTTNLSAREAWLEGKLRSIPKDFKILDAGAGEQQYKKFCSHLQYVSQDFAQYSGSGDGAGLQMGAWEQSNLDIVSDITKIPRADGSFDAVMCVEVLEHVPSPIAAMTELVRVLNPGGYLLITVPFCSLTHFSPYFYHTGFSRYFFEHWLNELGLDIVDLELNGNYYDYLAQELRRIPGVNRTYIGSEPNIFQKILIFMVMQTLKGYSKKGNKSQELLCFGIQVFARKRTA